MKKTFLLSFSLAFLLYSCAPVERYIEEDSVFNEVANDKLKKINVLLADSYSGKSLKFSYNVILYNLSEQKLLEIPRDELIKIETTNGKIRIRLNAAEFIDNGFIIVPKNSADLIVFENKRYRGELRVVFEDNKARMINRLTTEDYLKGVVPAEYGIANSASDYEALKAFCIVARTYAYSKIYNSKKSFDVKSDISDQVYKGYDIENQLSSKAIDETRHICLFFDGIPAQTFYHSSCGGYIEDVANVFSDGNYPYLKTKNDKKQNGEAYCSIAPKFYWTETMSSSKIISNLKNYNSSIDIVSVKNVYIESKFASGRVKYLVFEYITSRNEIKTISLYGNNIRFIMLTESSNSSLRSTMFDIEKKFSSSTGNLEEIKFIGRGYGHGVGFCQYGAKARSNEGQNFEKILMYYFPQTYFVRIK